MSECKPVKALNHVRYGQLVGKDNVQVVNIGKMIADMMALKRGLVELSDSVRYKPNDCPLRGSHVCHAYISKLLVDGGWTWNCPFCGENFQD